MNKIFMWGFAFVFSFIGYIGFLLPQIFSINSDFMFGIFAVAIITGYFWFKFIIQKIIFHINKETDGNVF